MKMLAVRWTVGSRSWQSALMALGATALSGCSGGGGGGSTTPSVPTAEVSFTSNCPGTTAVPFVCAESIAPAADGTKGAWDLVIHAHGMDAVQAVRSYSFDVIANPNVVLGTAGGVVQGSNIFFKPIGGANLADADFGRSSFVLAQQNAEPSLLAGGDLVYLRLQVKGEGSTTVSLSDLRTVAMDSAGHPEDVAGVQVAGGTISVVVPE